MVVRAPRAKTPPTPPTDPADYWLDPEWMMRKITAYFEGTEFLAESIPSHLLMAGCVTMAVGNTPHLPTNHQTIWFDQIAVDWERPPRFDLDLKDPWFQRYEKLHCAALAAAARDDFMIGQACVLPGNDMLSPFLGTQELLIQVHENAQWLRETFLKFASEWVAIIKYFADLPCRRTILSRL